MNRQHLHRDWSKEVLVSVENINNLNLNQSSNSNFFPEIFKYWLRNIGNRYDKSILI